MIKRRNIYKVGKVRIQLTNPDLDGDGVTGGVEQVSRSGWDEIIPAQQKSETAEATENLNKDVLDNSRLSTMDFLSRINPAEYDPMTKIDVLIALRFLPKSTAWINRTKMRKSVSLSGEGRREFVDLFTGQKEAEANRMAKAAGFFTGKKKDKDE